MPLDHRGSTLPDADTERRARGEGRPAVAPEGAGRFPDGPGGRDAQARDLPARPSAARSGGRLRPRALARLLFERPALSIGVARRQLIIEGVATESSHPVLAELAGKLHRHHLGAVKLLPGISRAELSECSAVVGLEAQREAQPIGMQPELLQSRWTNVKLFPLNVRSPRAAR